MSLPRTLTESLATLAVTAFWNLPKASIISGQLALF